MWPSDIPKYFSTVLERPWKCEIWSSIIIVKTINISPIYLAHKHDQQKQLDVVLINTAAISGKKAVKS